MYWWYRKAVRNMGGVAALDEDYSVVEMIISELFSKGWTTDDAAAYIRATEYGDPTLDEDIGLRLMGEISGRYEGRRTIPVKIPSRDLTGRRVAAAAVLRDGLVYTMSPPARHHTIVHWMVLGLRFVQDERMEQGFILDDDSWVRRAPAKWIAEEAGQLLRPSDLRELYSEDLW